MGRDNIISKAEHISPSLYDAIFASVKDEMIEQTRQLNDAVDFACRHLVTPPIKGEITRGKVKWRGLRLVFLPTEMKAERDGDKMNFTYEHRYELWQRNKKIF